MRKASGATLSRRPSSLGRRPVTNTFPSGVLTPLHVAAQLRRLDPALEHADPEQHGAERDDDPQPGLPRNTRADDCIRRLGRVLPSLHRPSYLVEAEQPGGFLARLGNRDRQRLTARVGPCADDVVVPDPDRPPAVAVLGSSDAELICASTVGHDFESTPRATERSASPPTTSPTSRM
jgi:hypothetical protein